MPLSACLLFMACLVWAAEPAVAQTSGTGAPSTPSITPALPFPATVPNSSPSQDTGGVNTVITQPGNANANPNGSPNGNFYQNSNMPQRLSDRPTDRDSVTSLRLQDPQTEFQQLVTSTTGRPIPIFGASLFQGVPSTFAPVENIPVTPDYVIGPGDELRLQVWGQVNQQGSYLVDRTGAISIPQLGAVHVAGIPFSGVREFLRGQLGRVYRNFDLNVNMGQLRSIQIFVVGQARRPGSYTIGSLSTLLNALFESGGPLPTGSLRNIQLKRGDHTVVNFDLYDLLLHGDKTNDVPLSPGDVIFIPPVGQQVALVGSVTNPAIYELRGETTVKQLLELGGGETSTAAGASVRLERIYEHRLRSVVDVDLNKPDAPALGNGDIVFVASINERFKDAVTLRGNVASPGRYVWHPGIRIRDLIPDKDALITRNYWRRRNELGQATSAFGPVPEPNEGSLLARGDNQGNRVDQGTQTGQRTQIDQGTQTDQRTQIDQRSQTDGRRQTDNSAAGSRQSGDSGGSSVGVALASNSGIFTPRTDVLLSAPDIDWSYAVVERQSPVDLTTSLLPFNLGRAILDADESQNLPLLAGDVVTIFSTADLRVPTSQQTRFVRLEGEFVASGVYSVRPGETLRGLLARAGGLTPDAYLYASEFTRQSTRRVERQRLNEYADQLEAQVSAATAGSNARALNDRDAAAADAQAVDARGAIARLRRLEPVGRIVLQLKPDSRGVDAVPDLALEDGDRFVVPRVPSNVNVEGQVYSANAFVFERDQRVLHYLREAGGPDRQADRKRAFVLRADGSVLSRQYANVERASIFPGDTIVVPPMFDRRAVLRNLVDIASIIGQFGVGVAAINLLR